MDRFASAYAARKPIVATLVAVALGLSGVATARRADAVCVGDCNNSGNVTVAELVVMVNIALNAAAVSTCTAGDVNHDDKIVVNEIVTAVNNLLGVCPA